MFNHMLGGCIVVDFFCVVLWNTISLGGWVCWAQTSASLYFHTLFWIILACSGWLVSTWYYFKQFRWCKRSEIPYVAVSLPARGVLGNVGLSKCISWHIFDIIWKNEKFRHSFNEMISHPFATSLTPADKQNLQILTWYEIEDNQTRNQNKKQNFVIAHCWSVLYFCLCLYKPDGKHSLIDWTYSTMSKH